MTYPQNGNMLNLLFRNDANGRRIDALLQSNANHTTWSAHESFSYDTSGRVTGVLGQNGPATSPTPQVNESVCYSYRAAAPACPTTASLDRSKVQWMSDTVTGNTYSYTYDANGRLTMVAVTGRTDPRTYTYGYDTAGNRTSAVVTGASPSTQSNTFNNDNQITGTGFAYDASGNLTASGTVSGTGSGDTYNSAGQRTSATTGGVTSTYSYAGPGQAELLSEATPGADTYSYTYGRDDVHGLPEIESVHLNATPTAYIVHDNTGLPVLIQTGGSGGSGAATSLYMYDAIGNPVALTTGGYTSAFDLRYDPYGAATRIDTAGNTNGCNDNPYGFQDGIKDRVTGDVKFGARWYNQPNGVWAQQDTLNAPLDPNNANRYAYAADDPINNTDPSGSCSIFEDGFDCISSTAETYVPPVVTAGLGIAVGAIGVSTCVVSGGLACGVGAYLVGVGAVGVAAGAYEVYETYQ